MKLTVTDTESFARDWALGLTRAEMAALYGVSMSAVAYTCRALRLPRRKPGWHNCREALSGGQWVDDGTGVKRWQAQA